MPLVLKTPILLVFEILFMYGILLHVTEATRLSWGFALCFFYSNTPLRFCYYFIEIMCIARIVSVLCGISSLLFFMFIVVVCQFEQKYYYINCNIQFNHEPSTIYSTLFRIVLYRKYYAIVLKRWAKRKTPSEHFG